MNKQLFKAAKYQEEYEEKGYFLENFFEPSLIEKIRKDFQSLFEINDKDGYYNTGFIDDPALKSKIHDYLLPYGQLLIDHFLKGYKLINLHFVVKKTANSKAYLHQDFPYSDERKNPTIYFWFPLQDVDFENGALHVIPQTHKIQFPFRGINAPDILFANDIDLEVEDLTCLSMKKGEVAVFDSRIIHASPSNTTPNSRVAALICAVPANEPSFIYKWDLDRKVLGKYAVDKQFMTHFVANSGVIPKGTIYLGEEPDHFDPTQLDQEELVNLISQNLT